MKFEVLQNAPLGAFSSTLYLQQAINGLENQFLVLLRVVVLHRFYCIFIVSQVMGSKMSKTHSGDKIPNLNQSTLTNLTHVRSSSTSLDVSFRSLSQPIVNTIMSPFFWQIRFRRTNNLDVTHTGTPSLTMPLTIFCTFGQLGWIVLENL